MVSISQFQPLSPPLPRTLSLESMRASSCGGSEYFLIPGEAGRNIFLKVMDSPPEHETVSTSQPREEKQSKVQGSSNICRTSSKIPVCTLSRAKSEVKSARSQQKLPVEKTCSGTTKMEELRRRSRSAGTIASSDRRRRRTSTGAGIDLENPSPVAAYINRSTTSHHHHPPHNTKSLWDQEGDRTSYLSIDHYTPTEANQHHSPASPSHSSSSATRPPTNDSLDNVTVVVRIRPFVEMETKKCDERVATNLGGGSILIDNGCSKPFTFNAVFDEHSSQSEFFSHCGVTRLVDKALEGFSCTVFAYGPTGSGKTHTITGPEGCFSQGRSDQIGLIQRSFMYLFDRIDSISNSSNSNNNKQQQSDHVSFFLKVSYLEVYNEKVKDLLNPGGSGGGGGGGGRDCSLKIRWTKERGFHVDNLFTVECETIEDIMIILEEGMNHRQMGVSNCNDHSSRSHTLLLCEVSSESLSPDDHTMYIHKHGHLTFVDLAGSEKLNQTCEGNLAETTNINKSLLALGNCISCLSDSRKRGGHIPYRESKLTQLLADSLGGNGITLMVACVSPSSSNLTESLNTLRYANRAKKIKNKPFVVMDPREKEIVSLRREVGALRGENEYLRSQIDLPKEQTITQLALKSARLKLSEQEGDESASLYEMVQAYMIENEQLRRDATELTHSRDKATHQLQDLAQENMRLVKKLEQFEAVFVALQNNMNSNGSSSSTNRGSNSNSNSNHASLHKPAMAGLLNQNQQTTRKNGGLPPVVSNKGVPNGLTSPRSTVAKLSSKSPERKLPSSQRQQATTSTSSQQSSYATGGKSPQSVTNHPGSFRASKARGGANQQKGERNWDSGVFSEDEQQQSEHSRRHKMNNRMGAGSNGATAAPSVQNSRTKQSNGNFAQQSNGSPRKTLSQSQNARGSQQNSETNELAQINQRLLKDIQSLDSEIEFYQQQVKKPRK
ncbi:uncharacterized protein LOC134841636 [Symsagittifera roscoffensis]|uniref:uncharacterized protein LOC134841636 n=1 Tax=Symsagittifera roscoffensis TaxID=84072 RepID=UPI00307B9DE8